MIKVFRSVIIQAPIEKVWAVVRAFDGVADWNPSVIASRMESGTSTSVGAIRHLDIEDGSIFRETLLAHSDQDYAYTYDIIEGPLPCSDYISTHRFVPITDGNKTLSIWTGEFNCAAADADGLEKNVGDQIYLNAMHGLNAHLTKE